MKRAMLILIAGLMGACGGAVDTDQGAAAESQDLTSYKELARATPREVADQYGADTNKYLSECSAAHPDIKMLSESNISRFTNVGSQWYPSLAETVRGLLATLGQKSISINRVRTETPGWIYTQIEDWTDASGDFKLRQSDLIGIDSAYERASEANAFKAAKAPAGIHLPQLRDVWNQMEMEASLDTGFIAPVALVGEPSTEAIRRKFAQGTRYEGWGNEAIDKFANASEGPNGNPQFEPIANALKKPSIRKRYFFSGGGHGWSRNYLIVIDEHNQLYGFMMGYSE